MLDAPVLRLPSRTTMRQLFVAFSFTFSGYNSIRARKFEVLKKKECEHWTLVWDFGWVKSLFSSAKALAPYFTFYNLFQQHILPFLKHIFLNVLNMEWCLILSKILKAKYSVKELSILSLFYQCFEKIVFFYKVVTILLVLQYNNPQQF